jgi:phage tail protein X
MYAAATTTPNATYSRIANNGNPATAKAGTAFPGNDGIAFPDGDATRRTLE